MSYDSQKISALHSLNEIAASDSITDMNWIWIFHGNSANFTSAAFDSKDLAEEWIVRSKVSGVLTRMPINMSVYDWAVEKKYLLPKHPSQRSPEFIQRFSSAYLEHFHYDLGVCAN